jgi:hypothetical protein
MTPDPDPTSQPARFDTIYARTLHLTDSHGRPRATLTVTENGAPTFALRDPGGTVRLSVRVDPQGAPVVALADGSGRDRVVVTVMPNGLLGVKMTDHSGEPRLGLGLLPDGQPYITATGSQGEHVWGFPPPASQQTLTPEQLLAFARANDREGFRLACERAGLDVDHPELGWAATRAVVAPEPRVDSPADAST